MLRRALIIIAITVLGGQALACSSGGDGAPSATGGGIAYTQTASVGGVEVEATWPGGGGETPEGLADYPPDRFLTIEVGMDTHSGDLGSVDMVQASSLQIGSRSLQPEAWVASNNDAHHRSGVLVFQRGQITGPVALRVALKDEVADLVWDKVPDGG
ncbi:MAG TPA: hypothetical protein VLS25_02100 [Dehalococcoidia bacterium]|nr:hypothetical protein [Dehalococcoidia bacterium]